MRSAALVLLAFVALLFLTACPPSQPHTAPRSGLLLSPPDAPSRHIASAP